MSKLLFCCCVAAFASAATAAPATAPETNQAAPNAAAAGVQVADGKPRPTVEKKICRNLEVGFSHRSERVCMTAKQWEEYDRDGS